MRLTRRAFGLGTIGMGFLGTGGPVAAVEAPSGARLQAALNACVAHDNPARAVFTVTGFETVADARTGTVGMRATVQLDWMPGMRRRTLRTSAEDPFAAFAALERSATGFFGPAVPGFAAPAEML